MPDDFQNDVFLSHSAKDKAVVRPLAERLRQDGLKVWFDEWEFPVASVYDRRDEDRRSAPPAIVGLGSCRARSFWHSAPRDLRTIAQRMAGVARPDSARAVSPERGAVRAIPGDGRQP